MVKEQFDIQLGFHPHVDTHVETQEYIDNFLEDTDPSASHCAWTPATSSTAPATTVNRPAPSRPDQLHPPQAGQPRRRGPGPRRRVGFYEAVQRGAMVEPPLGAPDMKPLLDDLAALNRDLRLIIEQDMYRSQGQRQGDRHSDPGLLHRPGPAARGGLEMDM